MKVKVRGVVLKEFESVEARFMSTEELTLSGDEIKLLIIF